MTNLFIEDIKVGIAGGINPCGSETGWVIAEARIRNTADGSISYHSLAEVEGALNFIETKESTFDIQMNVMEADDESNQKVSDGNIGGYDDYNAFYEDLKSQTICDKNHILIWKYLAYMVRSDWDEIEQMKAKSIGKCLGNFKIPVCDAEQEYLDDYADEE